IAFALGEDVSVNTIIGWPTIKTLQIDVLSSVNLAVSHQIRERFPIIDREAHHGLPQQCDFTKENFQRPSTAQEPTPDSNDAIHAYAATSDPPNYTNFRGSAIGSITDKFSCSYLPNDNDVSIL
ncbi:MAG: hypothetical protein ACREBR_03275, partial [bacterium]